MQLDRASALWMNLAIFLLHLAMPLSSAESCNQSSSGDGGGGGQSSMRLSQPWILVDFISCRFQRSKKYRPDRAAARHLRLPGFAGSIVRTLAGLRRHLLFPPSFVLIFSSSLNLAQRDAAR